MSKDLNEEEDDRLVILLADDSRADIRLTEMALERISVPYQLQVVRDGVEAMKYLRQEDEFADAPKPDLMLLDLNMPKKDGREVLVEIKQDPALKRLPVLIFSTSDAFSDIDFAYKEHANGYVTKPLDLQAYLGVFRQVAEFWLQTAKLPRRS